MPKASRLCQKNFFKSLRGVYDEAIFVSDKKMRSLHSVRDDKMTFHTTSIPSREHDHDQEKPELVGVL